MNQRKTGAILTYVTLILSNVISILYTPVMLRLLGQSEYGLLGLVNSITGYLGLLTFGIGASFIRNSTKFRINGDKEGEYRLNGMYFSFFLVIAAITLVCGFIMAENIRLLLGSSLTEGELYRAKIIMYLTVINMAVNLPFGIYEMNINAYEKFLFAKILNVVKTLLNPFITLPLLLMGFRSVAMTAAALFISIVSLLANAYYAKKYLKMKIRFGQFDKPLVKQIFAFSSFIFLNLIIDQLNWNIDKFILGVFKGTAAVAVYTIGSQMNTYLLNFSTTITSVMVPKINNMVISQTDDFEITKEFAKVGRLQFMITALIILGYFGFGRRFIALWAGADYSQSFYVGLLLMVSTIVPSIQTLGIEIRKAKNKHMIVTVFLFFMAVANLLISIPLCKKWGPIGSALGTTISLLINAVFNNIYYQKYIKMDMRYFWKEILSLAKSMVIPAVLSLILFFVNIQNVFLYILTGAGFIGIYSGLVYFRGMNSYEKNLLLSGVHKITARFRGTGKD